MILVFKSFPWPGLGGTQCSQPPPSLGGHRSGAPARQRSRQNGGGQADDPSSGTNSESAAPNLQAARYQRGCGSCLSRPRPVCPPPTSLGDPPGHTRLDGHLQAGALLSRSLSEAGPPGAHGPLLLPWSWSPQGPLTPAIHPRRLLLLGAEAPPPPAPHSPGQSRKEMPRVPAGPPLGFSHRCSLRNIQT